MSGWWHQTWSYWQSGGPLLLPIALVCAGIWGYFLRSRDALARTLREGAGLEHALDRGTLGHTPREILRGLAGRPGAVAAVTRSAVEDATHRAASPRQAFLARENEALRLLRKDVVVLAALTTVAPLLGLLGTVMGMIETFDAVAAVAGETGTRVSAGISRALITTQFGLLVALPGVFGITRLQRMLRNTQVVMAQCRTHTLQILESNKVPGAPQTMDA